MCTVNSSYYSLMRGDDVSALVFYSLTLCDVAFARFAIFFAFHPFCVCLFVLFVPASAVVWCSFVVTILVDICVLLFLLFLLLFNLFSYFILFIAQWRSRLRRRLQDREYSSVVPDLPHRQLRAVGHGRPPQQHHLPHLWRLRRPPTRLQAQPRTGMYNGVFYVWR